MLPPGRHQEVSPRRIPCLPQNAHLFPSLLGKARLPQPRKKPGSRVNHSTTKMTKRTETAFSAKVMGPSSLCSVWMMWKAARSCSRSCPPKPKFFRKLQAGGGWGGGRQFLRAPHQAGEARGSECLCYTAETTSVLPHEGLGPTQGSGRRVEDSQGVTVLSRGKAGAPGTDLSICPIDSLSLQKLSCAKPSFAQNEVDLEAWTPRFLLTPDHPPLFQQPFGKPSPLSPTCSWASNSCQPEPHQHHS